MMNWKKTFGEKMQKNITNNLVIAKCKIHRQILGELVFFYSIKGDDCNNQHSLLINCSCSHILFSESDLPLNCFHKP